MKKIIWTGLLSGLAMLILGLVINAVVDFIFPSVQIQYMRPGLFRSWTDPLMSLYFLYPFVLGFVLAWVWSKIKGCIKGNVFARGVSFGFGYWVVASIPGMLITYSSFQVSLLMTFTWTLSGLLSAIVAGLIFAKWNR